MYTSLSCVYSLVFISTVSGDGMADVTTPPQTTSSDDTLSGMISSGLEVCKLVYVESNLMQECVD